MTDNNFLSRLNKNSSLTDVLIQVEDFLDSLDLYVFKNWFEGEVVEGPDIQRYWVSITLKYAYKDMPDPAGGVRLLKHGASVQFERGTEEVPVSLEDQQNPQEQQDPSKPKMTTEKIWLVKVRIPRRFIEELDDDDLSLYDQEVDTDSVSDARDENIDAADALKDNSDEDADPDADAMDSEEDPQ